MPRARQQPPPEPPIALVGLPPSATGRELAPVDWDAPDLYGGSWDENRVRHELGIKGDHPVIYRSFIELSDLNEVLAEEEEGDPEAYDWTEFQTGRSSPPPIVVVRQAKDNKLVVMDGNHRTRFAKERGFEYIGGWVYDEALTKYARRTGKIIRVVQDDDDEA